MSEHARVELGADLTSLDVDHIVDAVHQRSSEGPAFIHVCGASASGKSTLSNGLARVLPDAQVFPMDAYLAEGLWDQTRTFNHDSPDPNRPYIAGISPDIWDMDLMEAHLEALRNNKPIEMPVFDETQKDRVGYRPFEPSRFVIVEGGHSFSERFHRFADYGVLVTAPLHDRLTRKMVRTHAVYGLDDVDEVVQRYLTKDEPVSRFYRDEHSRLADQVVFNEANPRRDYARLAVSGVSRATANYYPLIPKLDTGSLKEGEALGIAHGDEVLAIYYGVDERILVDLPIQDRTADLLVRHYEVGSSV